MAEIPSTGQLVVALRPWLRTLKRCSDIKEYSKDPLQTLYIFMSTDNSPPDHRSFEALELLALVGEIDFDAWKQAIAIVWPDAAPLMISLSRGRALRLGCHLEFDYSFAHIDTTIDNWCERIVVDAMAETTGSRGYAELRQSLEHAYTAAETKATTRYQPKPVPRDQLIVPVELCLPNGDNVAKLRKILQLAATQHLHDTSVVSTLWTPLLRVVQVVRGHGYTPIDPLTPKAFLYLSQIARCGVDVDQIQLYGADIDHIRDAQLVAGLQSILGSSTHANKVGKSRGDGKTLSRRAASAIYSALLTSQSVQAVSLNAQALEEAETPPVSLEDRAFLWRWLAFAIFSRDASHRLDSIHFVSGNLEMQDIECVRHVLEHPDPATFVVVGAEQPCGALSSSVSQVEFVSSTHFRLSLSEATGSTEELELPLQDVRILHQNTNTTTAASGHHSVLLPGWGHAWVPRQDDTSVYHFRQIDTSTYESKTGSTGITELSFGSVNDRCKDAVLALLRLVGSSVQTVTLGYVTCSTPIDAWLCDILEACPQLGELEITLGGKLNSLDTITAAFERGIVRHLWRLDLNDISVVNTTNTSSFFRKLADPHHPMAQQLRDLRLRSEDWQAPPQCIGPEIVSMLQTNTRLRDVHIELHFSDYTPLDHVIGFRIHEDGTTAVAEQKLPLDLRQKVALLSVNGTNELPVLDSHVLSLIFHFAAQCYTRNAFIYFRDDDTDDDDEDEQ